MNYEDNFHNRWFSFYFKRISKGEICMKNIIFNLSDKCSDEVIHKQ